ncbi:UNVERIFIED_CONTAM: hypothetical protein GTU68_047899, partial [Idotea baltica]|nr:hypothetical protein [Idotea baltica]
QVVFASLLAIAVARPDYPRPAPAPAPAPAYAPPAPAPAPAYVKILRDDRVNPEAGSYSFDVETEDGIVRSESGSPLSIEGNPTGQQGSISFPLPNGETFSLKFVANENGYQPESPFLPVAPEFPHPIPQFVLDQIAFAAQEDAAAAKAEVSAPQQTYGYQ